MDKYGVYSGLGKTTLDIKGKLYAFSRGKMFKVTEEQSRIFAGRREFDVYELDIDTKGMPSLKDMIYNRAAAKKSVDARRLNRLKKMTWAALQRFKGEFNIPGKGKYKVREELESDIIKYWSNKPIKKQKIAVRSLSTREVRR